MSADFGPEKLIAGLHELGMNPERVEVPGCTFAVIREYLVEAGRFDGKVVDLGLQCTADFPMTVHSSIHVKANPHLFPFGNIQNVRNIQPSLLGPEWQYWSKNFNWRNDGTVRRLLSQINRIFLDA